MGYDFILFCISSSFKTVSTFCFICLYNLLLYILLAILDYQALERARNLLTSHVVCLAIVLGSSLDRRDACRCASLILEAEENGISFDHVLDPQEKYQIALGAEKKLKLEQLNRKFISEENCLRIAEELKKNTQ